MHFVGHDLLFTLDSGLEKNLKARFQKILPLHQIPSNPIFVQLTFLLQLPRGNIQEGPDTRSRGIEVQAHSVVAHPGHVRENLAMARTNVAVLWICISIQSISTHRTMSPLV